MRVRSDSNRLLGRRDIPRSTSGVGLVELMVVVTIISMIMLAAVPTYNRIQRKIDGVRTSKLGYLYRPSYFTGGFALHGEAYDVPVYPASHGCVRMTNYNTDLLYKQLAVGTPVHVFDS